jgi:hypothetical protein
MSGPKVVRIVTREEIEAICRRHLASVEVAAEEFRRALRRHGLADPERLEEIEAHRRRLVAMFEAEKFLEIQKLAPQMAEFMRVEANAVKTRAVAAAEAARARRRNLVDAARTLAAALENAGHPVPVALAQILRSSGASTSVDEIEGALNAAFRLLVPPAKMSTSSAAQHQLAARLNVGNATQSFAEWLAEHPSPAEPRNARLDRALSEIETFGDPELVGVYSERAARIATERAVDRRALLTDSLILEAAEQARRLREEEGIRTRLRAAIAALEASRDDEAKALAQLLAAAVEANGLNGADRLLTQSQDLLDRIDRERAAAARRRAVLCGLAALGYEVDTNMETAWARDGRIIVRKPGATDYAIELGAPEDASRLQVRLVGADRPTNARSPDRDRDQEVIWCSEFERLKSLMSDAGGAVLVDRAVAPGAQAVKTVSLDAGVPVRPEEIERPVAQQAR